MDDKLLYELYQAYAGELTLYLYSLCRNREAAKDLLQETFLKAMLSLPSDHTNFRAWLYRVARNLCYNWLRDRKREYLFEELENEVGNEEVFASVRGEAITGGNAPLTPLDSILRNERSRKLYEGILTLAPAASQVILLQYFGGLSQREIAEVLGLSPGNVRVIACRAREQLKAYMRSYEEDEPTEMQRKSERNVRKKFERISEKGSNGGGEDEL